LEVDRKVILDINSIIKGKVILINWGV